MTKPSMGIEDAVTEFASILTLNQTPQSTMQLVVDLTKATIGQADAVGLTLVSGEGFETAAYTDEWVLTGDVFQYQLDDGPCLEGIRTNKMVVSHDLSREQRWQPFPDRVTSLGVRSMLTVPLLAELQLGGLNIYSKRVDVFDDMSQQIGALLARPASAAITNVQVLSDAITLTEQLREAMESRAVIEQAKGILMATRMCTAEDAFAYLKKVSQHQNRKLREIAAEVVSKFAGRHRGGVQSV